jgi:hypothetical protein
MMQWGSKTGPSTPTERIIMALNPPSAATATLIPNHFTDDDDTCVIKQTGDDKFEVSINGSRPVPYTKEQIEALSAAGYFNGRGGDDSFEVDVQDKDLKLMLIGGEDHDTVKYDNITGHVAFFQDQGQDQGQGHDQGHAPAGNGAPSTQGNTEPAAGTTTATPPVSTTAGAAPGGNGNIVISGNGNNTIYTGSATPTTAGSGTAAPSTTSTPASNFSISSLVAANPGMTMVGTNAAQLKSGGLTIYLTQPGGPGTPMSATLPVPGVPDNSVSATINPDGSVTNVKGTGVVGEALANNDYLTHMLEVATGKMKKKGAHGNTSAVSDGGGGAAAAATGSADAGATGATGSDMGASDSSATGSTDPTSLNGSGLDTGGSDGSDSWFLVLAEGMGDIMNKFAAKMIKLLNEIKNAGDNPPYKLTADFQATSQQLAFMQQAFMTALNSLGESIKTGVTAGGAAR